MAEVIIERTMERNICIKELIADWVDETNRVQETITALLHNTVSAAWDE